MCQLSTCTGFVAALVTNTLFQRDGGAGFSVAAGSLCKAAGLCKSIRATARVLYAALPHVSCTAFCRCRAAVQVQAPAQEGRDTLQRAQPARIQHGAHSRPGGPDRPAHRQPDCAGDPGIRLHLPGAHETCCACCPADAPLIWDMQREAHMDIAKKVDQPQVPCCRSIE